VTPWQILGVPPASSREDAERAYRQRMKRAHPDAGGSIAEAAALNDAIAWVRRRSLGAPAASQVPPVPPPWRSGPGSAAQPVRATSITRRRPAVRPAAVAATVLGLLAVAIVVANWETLLLATATLLAVGIIATGFRG
jgi:hypothetical protein